MSKESNIVSAPIAIKGDPTTACFTTVGDFIEALPNFLVAEIPTSITNVVISNIQPLDSQRTDIWFRLSNGGTFIGIYVFSDGTWIQMFPPPQGLFSMYGDSRDVPKGYVLADENNGALPPGVGLWLKQRWKLDPTNTFYQVFDTTYEGL